jgi:acetyl-CoA synthetase
MTDSKAIATFSAENRRFEPSAEFRQRARIQSKADYERLYRESLDSPDGFWKRETSELVFDQPWHTVTEGQLPHVKWFLGAELNVTKSCLDRHLPARKDKRAIVWESEPGEVRTLTYGELHAEVVRFAAALRGLGVKKGDRVAIYMGMVPEVVVGMLACARIGAAHSVVFGGFAAESLRDRINDCQAKVVLTQDGAWRRGGVVPLKATVDRAVESTPSIEKVVVLRRLGQEHAKVTLQAGRDVWWHEACRGGRPGARRPRDRRRRAPAVHPLHLRLDRASPRACCTPPAGYLAGTHAHQRYVFDLARGRLLVHRRRRLGHRPQLHRLRPALAAPPCLMYEGAPNQPGLGPLLADHRAPQGHHPLHRAHRHPRLHEVGRRLGREARSVQPAPPRHVGEPINPEAWMWYHEIGGGAARSSTPGGRPRPGAIMITPLPGATPTKPGSTTLPVLRRRAAEVVDDRRQRRGSRQRGRPARPAQAVAQHAAHDLGRRRALQAAVLQRDPRQLLHRATARARTKTATSGRRPHRRRAQRRRPPHRHRRDRERARLAPVGGRGRRGRPPRRSQGPGAGRVRHAQARVHAGPELARSSAHVGKEIGKFAKPDQIRFADACPRPAAARSCAAC